MATHSSVLAWRIPGMGAYTIEATQQQQQQQRSCRPIDTYAKTLGKEQTVHKFQTNSSCVISICCCSVDKSCPTLSNPMNYSMSLTISWSLPKFMSIESVMQPTISSSVALFSFFLQSFPASGSFPMNQLFTSGGQNIGASASASVLPRSMQC